MENPVSEQPKEERAKKWVTFCNGLLTFAKAIKILYDLFF
jgi:hypothetical protein